MALPQSPYVDLDADTLVTALAGPGPVLALAREAVASGDARWWASPDDWDLVREEEEKAHASEATLPDSLKVGVPGFEQMLLDLRATPHRALLHVHLRAPHPDGPPERVWTVYLSANHPPELVAASGPILHRGEAMPDGVETPEVPPWDPWEGVELDRIDLLPEYEKYLRVHGPRSYARVLERQRAGAHLVQSGIHPDDPTSEGEPELWVVVDCRTGEWLAEGAMDDFAWQPGWVDLEGLLDEIRDERR